MMDTNPPTQCPNVTLMDAQGRPSRLQDFWKARPTAFALMRHSGCTFCREYASILQAARPQFDAAGIGVVIILQSEPAGVAAFQSRLAITWPCLSDADKSSYQAFGLSRGSIGQLLGPRVWWKGFQAFIHGHGVGRLDGDGLQLGGTFGVGTDGRIIYRRPNEDASDNPTPAEIISAMQSALAREAVAC